MNQIMQKSLEIKARETAQKIYVNSTNGTVGVWFVDNEFKIKRKSSGNYGVWLDKYPDKLVGIYTPKCDRDRVLEDMLCEIGL